MTTNPYQPPREAGYDPPKPEWPLVWILFAALFGVVMAAIPLALWLWFGA